MLQPYVEPPAGTYQAPMMTLASVLHAAKLPSTSLPPRVPTGQPASLDPAATPAQGVRPAAGAAAAATPGTATSCNKVSRGTHTICSSR